MQIHKTFAITNIFISALELKVELHLQLNSARRIRRGEAAERACRVVRFAKDANISFPHLTEEERAAGDVIHILEVGPVEEVEGVEDEFEPRPLVGAEADSPSHSQISAEE